MDLVYLKDVIGGRKNHLFGLGENHRVEHVDRLGYICHFHSVAVIVEDIEGDAGHVASIELQVQQCVAYRIVLV